MFRLTFRFMRVNSPALGMNGEVGKERLPRAWIANVVHKDAVRSVTDQTHAPLIPLSQTVLVHGKYGATRQESLIQITPMANTVNPRGCIANGCKEPSTRKVLQKRVEMVPLRKHARAMRLVVQLQEGAEVAAELPEKVGAVMNWFARDGPNPIIDALATIFMLTVPVTRLNSAARQHLPD